MFFELNFIHVVKVQSCNSFHCIVNYIFVIIWRGHISSTYGYGWLYFLIYCIHKHFFIHLAYLIVDFNWNFISFLLSIFIYSMTFTIFFHPFLLSNFCLLSSPSPSSHPFVFIFLPPSSSSIWPILPFYFLIKKHHAL